MTNAQHTPGPWGLSISAPDSIQGCQKLGRIMAGEIIIAQCEKPHPYGAGFHTEANARLIAAAPDLLETLKYCQSWFEKFAPVADLIDGNKCELPMLTSVRAAIAKAEGK